MFTRCIGCLMYFVLCSKLFPLIWFLMNTDIAIEDTVELPIKLNFNDIF